MVSRKARLRVSKNIRKNKKLVSGFGQSANKQLDRHFFRRWHNVRGASRFTFGWLALMIILIVGVIVQSRLLGNYYLANIPATGGAYSEGMMGEFNGANPIYATTNTDLSVSKLIFAGLLTYDNDNKLVGDLAESWSVDDKGLVYTVKLKPNLVWQDGQSLTTDDVVYTYTTIQNPDAKSPLLSNWTGIKIQKVDTQVVQFILPNTYSPFEYSLTTGIVPSHILKDVSAGQLRSSSFNTEQPIGAGPFKWKGINVNGSDINHKTELVQLNKFDKYNGGTPKIDSISFTFFSNADDLKKALSSNKLTAASGLNVPDKDIDADQIAYNYPLMSANMLFLKTTSAILSDVKVRQALTYATNPAAIQLALGYATIPVREPLLRGQLGYDASIMQLPYNKAEANKQLDSAGWLLNPGDKFRKKDGQQLNLNFKYDTQISDYKLVAETLQKQWADVGVNLVIDNADKDTQKLLDTHEYDVLLYGINIGPDPDVFAYWDSTQADKKLQVHLNLSEYKSKAADLALESARTRTDPKVRTAKYKSFLEAWRADAPAIGLYQSRYLVVSNQPIFELDPRLINVPSDRFNNVNQWMINTKRTSSSN